MSDTIGRIAVPDLVDSGLLFPLTTDFGYGYSQPFPVVVHRFGTGDAKREQRYQTGIGPRKFAFKRAALKQSDRNALIAFWENLQGPWQTFLYNFPNPDQSLGQARVIWESVPLSVDYLIHECRVGFNFIEVPTGSPSYGVDATVTRFPSSAMSSALLDQVQQFIPLVHIKVRESAVPEIYLSDRRCTVGSQSYLPRLLDIGESGSGDLISQSLGGSVDDCMLTFGNADRVMTQLANDTDLRRAEIDFSLYHVNSGTLLQLWAGEIITYSIDKSPRFSIKAGDPLSDVTRQYPVRNISRSCFKTLNGPGCPYASVGSGGDPTVCDYTFDGTNGCVAHNMTQFFGGLPAAPQGVNIKDNSTGTWGFGRNRVTATSIVSDSVYGNALQEIWCNSNGDVTKAFWLNGMIIAVRDESDFVDALGVVGAGPIGQYTAMQVAINADGFRYIIAPLLDGQPPHGFQVDSNLNVKRDEPGYGLREIAGNDPQADIFGMTAGGVAQGNATAAGTAFIEIRRTDQKGIQPSTPDQHTLTVPIDKGLTGWTWDAGGTRTSVSGLTNPFWIAINTYLRAIGLFNADSATQLSKFNLASVFAGDGSGAAEIADLTVTPLVGTGTEKQFTFNGLLAQQKPYRDWLNEILASALGYFTWDFGKLTLGCRMNATPVDTYEDGNILFQSLQLDPIDPKFEKLTIDFADAAYQYQANTADYEDKDHSAYFGRNGSPLSSPMHQVGVSTLSQALRLVATRTREEIGGTVAAEWLAARNAGWQTTLLGLSSRPGQVISITDPDVPGGVADYRIQSWRLRKDYSVQITASPVTASMYDLTTGTVPTDVASKPVPPLRYTLPLDLVWNPFQDQANAADALYPGEYNFDANAAYTTLTDGSAAATVTVTGKLPVNDYSTTIFASPLIGSLAVNASGGSIAGNFTIRLSLCAVDSSGKCSNVAPIMVVPLTSGTTWQIVLDNITWPGNTGGIASWALFGATADDLMCEQMTGSGTPTTITWNGPVLRSTWGIPSAYLNKVRIKGKRELAAGVTAGKVVSASGTNITVTDPATSVPFVSGSYAGRVLSVIGRQGGSIPFAHFNITANSGTSFTLDRAVTGVSADDIVLVRFGGGSTGTSLSDSAASFTSGALVGNVVRIIAGTGRGQIAKITANTTTGITLADSLTLDSTSVWIVEEAAWSWTADGTTFNNALNSTQAQWSLQMTNLAAQSALVSGFTVDIYGNENVDGDQPVREVWLTGFDPHQAVAPTGTQNGTNPTFTLPSTPTNPLSVKLFKNGLLLDLTLDYTISGTTITYVVPPQSDDWLEATYF